MQSSSAGQDSAGSNDPAGESQLVISSFFVLAHREQSMSSLSVSMKNLDIALVFCRIVLVDSCEALASVVESTRE